MGTSDYSRDSSRVFNRQNWEVQPKTSHIQIKNNSAFSNQNKNNKYRYALSQNNYTLLRNKATGQIIYQFPISFSDEESYHNFLNMYSFRNNNSEYLVQGKHIKQLHQRDLCTINYEILMYVQYAGIRLLDVESINFNESLQVLRNSVKGFKLLYQQVGHFQITPELIFVTSEGTTKVWMNKNLGTNYGIPVHYWNQNPQVIMIQDLIKIIEEKVFLPSIQPNILFSQFLKRHQRSQSLNFRRLDKLFQQYIRTQKLVIPQSCEGILKDIRQKNGLAQSNTNLNQLLSKNLFKESEVKRMKISCSSFAKMSYVKSQSYKTYADNLRGGRDTETIKKLDFFSSQSCINEQQFQGSQFAGSQVRYNDQINTDERQMKLSYVNKASNPSKVSSARKINVEKACLPNLNISSRMNPANNLRMISQRSNNKFYEFSRSIANLSSVGRPKVTFTYSKPVSSPVHIGRQLENSDNVSASQKNNHFQNEKQQLKQIKELIFRKQQSCKEKQSIKNQTLKQQQFKQQCININQNMYKKQVLENRITSDEKQLTSVLQIVDKVQSSIPNKKPQSYFQDQRYKTKQEMDNLINQKFINEKYKKLYSSEEDLKNKADCQTGDEDNNLDPEIVADLLKYSLLKQ